MKTETLIWTIVLLLGAGLLIYRCVVFGVPGQSYVRAEEKSFVEVVDPATPNDPAKWMSVDDAQAKNIDTSGLTDEQRAEWTVFEQANPLDYTNAVAADPDQTTFRYSFMRSLGTWLAAFFTLAIFSFLYRDNPLYKIAESTFIGVSAAYWMVVAFWTVLVPNLFGKLLPDVVRSWAMPGLEGGQELLYIVPLILGIMLLWRLAPVGGWISRWPLAFIIGIFCGLRLMGFFHGDFLNQIRNAIDTIYVPEGNWWDTLWSSVENVILVFGVLACLVYFFFSVEHKGVVGKTARVGIWILMITFGAGFGYTVMGRIALLAIRVEFLLDDWLWLIDPTDKRVAVEAATAMISHIQFLM